MLYPRRWLALVVVLLAAFMDLLDTTIVNVAIPSIQTNISASYASIQWITAGYTLAFGLALITGGRLGDVVGRKRMFIIGVAGFALASLACGVAPNAGVLIAMRFVQGVMAAMMVPQILALITTMFAPKERALATGLYGGIAGLAITGGPIIGGLLLRANLYNLDWRPIFLVNVPVGIIALIAAALFLPSEQSHRSESLDLPGVALMSLGLLCLLYALIQGRELGWPLWLFGLMGLCIPIFALFAWLEIRLGKAGGEPLITASLFRKHSFVMGLVVLLTFFGVLSVHFLLISLTLQIGLGFTPLHSGLTGLPWSIGVGAMIGVSTALAEKYGRVVPRIGTLIMAAGIGGIAYTLNKYGADVTSWQLMPSMIVGGAGMGFVLGPTFNIVLSAVEPQEVGSASGVVNAAGQVGGALGVATIGLVFFNLLPSQAPYSADAFSPQVRLAAVEAHLPLAAQDKLAQQFTDCYHDRTAQKDPNATPASCVQKPVAVPAGASQAQIMAIHQAEAKVSAALQSAGKQANARNFLDVEQRTLVIEMAMLFVVFVLTFYLPKQLLIQDARGSAEVQPAVSKQLEPAA